MRILHVDRQRSFTGQVARQFREALGLRAEGHQVGFVASPTSELRRRALAEGFTVLALPMRGLAWYRSILRLAEFICEFCPDVIHAHGARDHLLAFAALRALPRGMTRPKLVRTKHNHTRLRSGPFSRVLYRATDLTIAVSEFVRQRLIDDGLDPSRVITIPTGIDLESFVPSGRSPELAKAIGLRSATTTIGHISSLHERKGVAELLHAFAILAEQRADLQLLVVGRNFEAWLDMAKDLGISAQVIFTGHREDVCDVLELMDVVVAPSRDEALGTAIVEAMALERSIVATHVGGIPECIGEAGVLSPARDAEALASRIARLIDSPEDRDRLGALARIRACSLFDVRTMVATTEAAYRRLLGPAGSMQKTTLRRRSGALDDSSAAGGGASAFTTTH